MSSDKKSFASFFRAETYTKINDLQMIGAKRVLEEYTRYMNESTKDEVVLDVGCGTGVVTRNVLLPRLPPKFAKLVACDISKNVLNYAEIHCEHSKVEYIIMDIEEEPPECFVGHFDQIYSFYCLNWIKNYRRPLTSIHRMLKMNGCTLLLIVSDCTMYGVWDRMGRTAKWSPYMTDYQRYIPGYHGCKNPVPHFRNQLEELGFTVRACNIIKGDYRCSDANVLHEMVRTLNPFVQNIPYCLLDDYWNDYMMEWRKSKNFTNDDPTLFHYNFIVTVCGRSI